MAALGFRRGSLGVGALRSKDEKLADAHHWCWRGRGSPLVCLVASWLVEARTWLTPEARLPHSAVPLLYFWSWVLPACPQPKSVFTVHSMNTSTNCPAMVDEPERPRSSVEPGHLITSLLFALVLVLVLVPVPMTALRTPFLL